MYCFQECRPTTQLEKEVDEVIDRAKNKKSYKHKEKTWADFGQFCRSLGVAIEGATPRLVCMFLHSKQSQGRTQVHTADCRTLSTDITKCDCATQVAVGTMKNLVSHIRYKYSMVLGKQDSWNESSRSGNPTDSEDVMLYLSQMKEDHSKGHVVRRQALPIKPEKFRTLCSLLHHLLHLEGRSPKDRYMWSRDQAVFKVMFFGGDRAQDLLRTWFRDIKWLPGHEGVQITHTHGKTASCDKPRVFPLYRNADVTICPVKGLDDFLDIIRGLPFAYDTGFVFRPLTRERDGTRPQQLDYASLYARLKLYLGALGMDEGEGPHSFRHTASLVASYAASTDDAQVARAQAAIGWKCASSAQWYLRQRDLADETARQIAQEPPGRRVLQALERAYTQDLHDFAAIGDSNKGHAPFEDN